MKQVMKAPATALQHYANMVRGSLRRWVLPFAAALGSGFLLAGYRLLGQALPVCVGLAAALELGAAGLGAVVGGSVGLAVLWGVEAGLPGICILLLILAAQAMFHNTTATEQPWFMPLLAAALTFLVGLVSLEPAPFKPLFSVLRPAVAALSCLMVRRTLARQRAGQCAFAGCLVCGMACLFPGAPVNVGVAAAFFLVTVCDDRDWGLLWAVCCGIGLDCAQVMAMPMTAALSVYRLVLRQIPRRQQEVPRVIGAALAAVCSVLFWLVFPKTLLLSACIGCGAGFCVPVRDALNRKPPRPYVRVRKRLSALSSALLLMEKSVQQEKEPGGAIGPELLYDHAADRVCKCCTQFRTCWGSAAEETYRALNLAAVPILSRGKALPEDFPPEFAQRCRHLSGFITTVNRELDELRNRRRFAHRTAEQQQLLASQLNGISVLIQRCCTPEAAAVTACYRLEMGSAQFNKSGGDTNGDQWLWVQTGPARGFVLLSDGMGTGPEAEQESKSALALLASLLKAGATAAEALNMLNNAYVLRGNGVFSAIDILALDLAAGEGVLHKWGSAATYWKHNALVKKLGLEAPPPGISLQDCDCETYPISLQHCQTLVMTTDGVPSPDTAQRISSYTGSNLNSLANYLIEEAELRSNDDMTVLALRLCPLHGK